MSARPVADENISTTLDMTTWRGGEMPVVEGTRVLVLHRDGEIYITDAGDENGFACDWSHEKRKSPGDIVAYIVVKRS